MIVLCPTCAKHHDVSSRITGDWLWCGGCGAWVAVQHGAGKSVLIAKSEPTRQHRRKKVK